VITEAELQVWEGWMKYEGRIPSQRDVVSAIKTLIEEVRRLQKIETAARSVIEQIAKDKQPGLEQLLPLTDALAE
jgi:intergrase/recombinase